MNAKPSVGQQSMGDIAPDLAELTHRLRSGDVWQRPQLAPRERSPASVAALIALNRGEQLPFHLHRTRDNGISRDEWVEPVTHLALHAGWPCAASAASALRALDTATTP